MSRIQNETDISRWFKLNETKVYSVNIRDIMNYIENVETIDIFQLCLESLITLFSFVSNILILMVIWELSLSHPGQALRAALALSDLLQGLFGCGMAVLNHSYYLWCANHPEMCNYNVNVIVWEGDVFVVHGTLDFIVALIYWTSWGSNVSILLTMAVDRYLAICNPLQYHSKMSMRRTRIAIGINWIIPLIYWLCFLLLDERALWWKSSYFPLTKMLYYPFTKKTLTLVNTAIYIIYVLTIIICMLSLSVLIIYQLKKASKISKELYEGTDKSSTLTEYIDFTKTLVISMVFEIIAVLIPPLIMILHYTLDNDKSSEKASTVKEYSFYFTSWLVMSSTCFNFVLYNLRIPAFRCRSLKVIKNGFTICSKYVSKK